MFRSNHNTSSPQILCGIGALISPPSSSVVNNKKRPLHEQVGMVAVQDLKERLGAGQEIAGVIAFDVMRPPPPCLTPSQGLAHAIPLLLTSEHGHVPVVNTMKESKLVGTVVRSEVLGMLSEAIAPRSSQRP